MRFEYKSRLLRKVAGIGLSCAFALIVASPGQSSQASAGQRLDPAEARARSEWRAKIDLIEAPAEGCFHASYPNMSWDNLPCKHGLPRIFSKPPKLPIKKDGRYMVGNGQDYAAGVNGLISRSVGSFPLVVGVKSEESVGVPEYGNQGILGPNEYSIQLNSNFATGSPACRGVPNCYVWQQFVYATDAVAKGEAALFIQYWLIFADGNAACPKNWESIPPYYCVRNSAKFAPAPDCPITDLAGERMSASARHGRDTVVFSFDKDAYSVSSPDRVVDLAEVWNQSEFNVIGDAGGSEAVFNPNSLIYVDIAVSSGSFTAPTCLSNSGTTGETNNLNLGPCIGLSGPIPEILFSESNISH